MLEGKRRGLIGDVDLRLFSIPTEEPTKIYLSENDIRTMKDLDLSDDKTMELARDIFRQRHEIHIYFIDPISN